jgi:hypothetical protein
MPITVTCSPLAVSCATLTSAANISECPYLRKTALSRCKRLHTGVLLARPSPPECPAGQTGGVSYDGDTKSQYQL